MKSSLVSMCVCDVCAMCTAKVNTDFTLDRLTGLCTGLSLEQSRCCLFAGQMRFQWKMSTKTFLLFFTQYFFGIFYIFSSRKVLNAKKVILGSFLPCLYFLNVYTFFLSSNCLTSPDYYLLSIAANHHQPSPPPILYQFVLVRRRDKFSGNLFCARRIIHHATHLLLLLLLRNAINSL